MTSLTDIDQARRLRSGRNAALVMLGVTVAGYGNEILSYFVITLCAIMWLGMALEKVAQLKVIELAPDERVSKEIVKR